MKALFKRSLQNTEIPGLVLLVVLVVLFSVFSNGIFVSTENLRGILGLLPEIGIVAIGVAILMIAGEFDLSVGSTFGLVPMVMVVFMSHGWGFAPAFGVAMLIGIGIGLVNAFVTLRLGIPSFITTLGMLFMMRSLTVVISGGFPPQIPSDVPRWLFTDYFGPGNFLRASFVWLVIIAICASLMLSRSNFGNWIKASGGQVAAAAALGVPVMRVKTICFAGCALLAGFAGVIQSLRLNSVMSSTGDGMELQAVAASVIGGVSLVGGIGTVFSAIIGALLIRVIDNGLVLTRTDPNWFKFAVGALIVFAVVANSWLQRLGKSVRVAG
ncbi:MAG: ABC transporter permease [Rhizobiales bacterium]|nr:ABC transporter permease [Hyphomicrobiales bacterium]